jgi:hypothetical protein
MGVFTEAAGNHGFERRSSHQFSTPTQPNKAMKAPSSAPVASLKSRSARRFLRQAVFPLVALACCASTSHAAGVLGTYYITEYFFATDTVAIDAIRGTSFVQNPTVLDGADLPIALIGDVVRTTGYYNGAFGGEYGTVPSLTLVPTGPVFTNLFAVGNDRFLDGTSNGINNFTVGFDSGNVIATDLNWGGSGSVLFNTGSGGYLGITYDRITDSLWIQSAGGGITNYAMDGTVLSSFSTELGRAALAMDIDHTLWSAFNYQGVGYLEQYATDGTYLGGYAVPGMGTYIYGGEISAIPEPSNFFGAVPLVAFGLFLRHRDRLRKQSR